VKRVEGWYFSFSKPYKRVKGLDIPIRLSGANLPAAGGHRIQNLLVKVRIFHFQNLTKAQWDWISQKDIWSKHKNLTEHSSAIFYFSTNLKVNFQFISK